MADDVVVYWVPFKGRMYAADMVARTYVAISSPERLEAAQRALTFAGIPHKGWGRGEPLTMEEFGTQAVDFDYLMQRIEAQGDRAHSTASAAVENSAESRRMLGVVFGWTPPAADTPEVAALPLLRNSHYAVVVDKDSGAWYAVAPGRFWHLKNFDEVNALRDAGILTQGQVYYDHARVELVRALVLREVDEVLPVVAPPVTYTVVKGDTFNGIAGRFGLDPDQLAALNPQVKDRNNLDIGQVLNLPKA